MLGRLLLSFTVLFIVEIWILFQVADETSFLFTFALCLFTFLLGLQLVRNAGPQLTHQAQAAASRGEDPQPLIAKAMLQLLAGFLLMVPGVITDIVGALLMLPPLHNIVQKRLKGFSLSQNMAFGGFNMADFAQAQQGQQAQGRTQSSSGSTSRHARKKDPDADFRFDESPFNTDFDDGYVPPSPTASGPVILDAEVVSDDTNVRNGR